ncbi:MAG: hypothetical protein R3330_02835 [Saprospiraceae bacterium]|nr:hypothetical protein [Saprospiraceae bacterium]
MAITATDILFKLSINSGPGDSSAQGDPNDSIGGYMSSTQITDATLHNLFDVITGDENAASTVDYRGFFVHNNHGSLTWQSVVVWLSSEVAGGADAAIALDGTGVVDDNSASQQMERIADEETAPSGESFSAPTTKGTGLAIGDIPAQDVQGIWVRRTANDTAAQASDGVTIRCEGDTAA